MIVIRESCNPPKVSHHAKYIGRFGNFTRMIDKPELIDARGFWDALFLPHRPPKPLEGPLALSIELRWPHPTSAPKKVQPLTVPMDVKPDLSNMAKTIEDSLGRCGFFVNDSQVCDLHLTKFRSPSPGIVVKLGAIDE